MINFSMVRLEDAQKLNAVKKLFNFNSRMVRLGGHEFWQYLAHWNFSIPEWYD